MIKFIFTANMIAIYLFATLNNVLNAQPKYRNAIDDPMGRQKSQVFDVFGEFSVRGSKIHTASLRKMLNTGVKRLTGLDDSAQAWLKFIHKDDVVALKFTAVGSRELATNTELAGVLLKIFYKIGFKPDNFILIGLHELPPEAQGTRLWKYGWQDQKVNFGADDDHLANWLNQVTAIINIPSIMDDNIFGLRCGMAGLAWEVIKSPARLYISQGDPFIAEIFNLPQIRGKLRLTIANHLKILYHGGPEVKPGYVFEGRTLIMGTDPVAVDRVALELVRRYRRENILPENAPERNDATYLETAQSLGIGYNDMNYIEYHYLKHDDNE